jgi:Zn-dependent M28 family amino/carboxypeptidase
MRVRIVSLLSLLLFSLCLFFRGDERISKLEDRISIENLKRHVRQLQVDRNPYDRYAALEEAARYIREELLKLGFEVNEDPFSWEGKIFRNVGVEMKGGTSPDNIFILGAHYDTVPGSPGADDNASGVAVLLEVARALRDFSFDSSVRLVAFCLEEYGFIGSTRYAERANKGGERILGMISLEMVGFTHQKQQYPVYMDRKFYPPVGDFIGIIGNTRSAALLERVHRSFKTHVPRLPSEYLIVPGNGEGMEEATLSDHSPFWDRGLPALMVTDTAFLRNPNYHLPTDTMETLDFEFMRKVAIGVLSSIVDLAK